MEVILTSYSAACVSTILWYPLRDMAKAGPPYTMNATTMPYILSRWKGMATHPYQPMLIAVPTASLYFGVWGGGALIGGFLHGTLRVALALAGVC